MTPSSVFFSRSSQFVLAAVFFIAGCDKGDEAITTYRAAKEVRRAPATAASGAAPGLHWSAPEGWEEQPASGFRKASFLVRSADGKSADVSVISFPEEAGGTLANVNRWRDQLKLAPITEEAQAGTTFPVAGHDMLFVELVSEQPVDAGTEKSRILGGIFPVHGETWFFKMTGPDEVVAAQRDAFQQFLRSVHLAGADHGHGETASPGTPPAGSSTNAPTPPLIETLETPPLRYTLPAGWQEKALSPMRAASFKASAPNGKEVDISVVTLAGEAGGDLANVNRWREQVKLPPIDEATLRQAAAHVQANGHDFLVVDLASTAAMGESKEKQRIVAAILDDKGRSWFIKMTGEEAAVASQKSAFEEFLRSLKFPSEG